MDKKKYIKIVKSDSFFNITINLRQVENKLLIIDDIKYVLEFLRKEHIIIIYQKLFLCEKYDDLNHTIVSQLDTWKQSPCHPLNIILFYPQVLPYPSSSVVLFGIKAHDLSNIEYYKNINLDAISYTYSGNRYFHVAASFIDGGSMFQHLSKCLVQLKFHTSDIIRTWFYLDKITEIYSDFNQHRNLFFAENQIAYHKGGQDLPASTCIAGKTYGNQNLLQLVGVKIHQEDMYKKRIYNEMQNEADGDSYLYQPAFSRAMLLKDTRHTELHISGTASIDNTGMTMHKNSPYQQMELTIRNILHILSSNEMKPEDICECTIFLKKKEYYPEFIRICSEYKLENLPYVLVEADICRDDLLFEIDGISRLTN